MTVQFKTDENLPATAAALLRSAGHDVTTALARGLAAWRIHGLPLYAGWKGARS